MNRLADKTAIATGCAIGTGRACVIHMAENANVAVFDTDQDKGR